MHVAYAPRSHLTDAIMRHAAERDALRAQRHGKHRKASRKTRLDPKPAKGKKATLKGALPMTLAATPILASAPAARRSGILRSSTDYLLVRPASFVKNTLQGALAGLMTFFGAIQFTGGGSSIVPTGDFASELPTFVTTALAGLPAGAATGAVGVIGAAILFMNAGRGIARLLGLLGFIAIAAAYANGANGDDLVPFLESIYHKIKGLLPLLAGIGL